MTKQEFSQADLAECRRRIDDATDEIAEALANFDLSDQEFLSVIKATRERLEKAQEMLLYGEVEPRAENIAEI